MDCSFTACLFDFESIVGANFVATIFVGLIFASMHPHKLNEEEQTLSLSHSTENLEVTNGFVRM